MESSQLSAECQQISVANLTSVLTVPALWYVHEFFLNNFLTEILTEISFVNVHNVLESGLTNVQLTLDCCKNNRETFRPID